MILKQDKDMVAVDKSRFDWFVKVARAKPITCGNGLAWYDSDGTMIAQQLNGKHLVKIKK